MQKISQILRAVFEQSPKNPFLDPLLAPPGPPEIFFQKRAPSVFRYDDNVTPYQKLAKSLERFRRKTVTDRPTNRPTDQLLHPLPPLAVRTVTSPRDLLTARTGHAIPKWGLSVFRCYYLLTLCKKLGKSIKPFGQKCFFDFFRFLGPKMTKSGPGWPFTKEKN